MSLMILILAVVVSALLLAQDTKRRTGQIGYWRVLLTVLIAFFGVASASYTSDIARLLGTYCGILALLWFLILRPKSKAQG